MGRKGGKWQRGDHTAWCQARQKETDLGKREGKEMEAAGGLWGKYRFLFVYASTAQHPRPDMPPSKEDVGGWAIYSKVPANSCRHPANLFLDVCLGKRRLWLFINSESSVNSMLLKCDQLRAQSRCGCLCLKGIK